MCKLLLGLNKKSHNKKFVDAVTKLLPSFEREPDGIAALIITFDNKLHIFRKLNKYNSVFAKFKKMLPEAKVAALHARTGTVGNKKLHNVHFFKSGEYYFAHNGTVPGLITETAKSMSDSQRFLKIVTGMAPVTISNLKKAVKKYRFVGFGVLIEEKTRKVSVIIQKDVHVDSRESFALFTSASQPEGSRKSLKNVFSLPTQEKRERVVKPGVYVIE